MAQIDDLLDAYRVDRAHARYVADLALVIFDAVAVRYRLAPAGRRLLEAGALLHNVGMTTDPPQHHLVGRDIVLRQEIAGLSHRDQVVMACMVAFHRKRVRPQLEPAFLGLGKKDQAAALQLAAILRVADGLDYSHAQATCIVSLEPAGAGMRLALEGPHAAGDGAQAIAKADLWGRVFGEALCVAGAGAERAEDAAPEGEQDGAGAAPLLPLWYAAPDAPLAELGRVLLRRQMRRMLAAERDVRADRDIEDIHALRVATRRLRATLRLLAPVAPAAEVRPLQKAISRVARVAGAVRDRDVLLAHMAESRAQLPAELGGELDAIAAELAAQRAREHRRLIEHFDGDAHAAFKADLARLLNSYEGWDDRPRVCDLAGSTIWHHYEALRAHDRGGIPQEGEPMHAMRIDAKKLRYVLELFAESFGERSAPVIAQLAAFQDELGALNDIAVARSILGVGEGAEGTPAVSAYLALRDDQGQAASAALELRWAKVGGAAYRRKLMDLIVRL